MCLCLDSKLHLCMHNSCGRLCWALGLPGLILCLGIRPCVSQIYSYVTKKLRVPSQSTCLRQWTSTVLAACLLLWLHWLEFGGSPGVSFQRSSKTAPGIHSNMQAGGGYLKAFQIFVSCLVKSCRAACWGCISSFLLDLWPLMIHSSRRDAES